MHVVCDVRCLEYGLVGHPECAARVKGTLDLLGSQGEVGVVWGRPVDVDEGFLERGHSRGFLDGLRFGVGDFDGDTPRYVGVDGHARRAVGGALGCLQLALGGVGAFSLMRPPGHHAMVSRAMGFCFLGSVGLAALYGAEVLGLRVGVFDFDVHHGNGTEDLLVGRDGVGFFSVHEFPCFPGSGEKDVGGNCFNFPVAPGVGREVYLGVLDRALDCLMGWGPDLVGVSAGFDGFVGDPLGGECLLLEDFGWLGSRVGGLGVPVFSVLEGGYSDELPGLVLAYLRGVEGLWV